MSGSTYGPLTILKPEESNPLNKKSKDFGHGTEGPKNAKKRTGKHTFTAHYQLLPTTLSQGLAYTGNIDWEIYGLSAHIVFMKIKLICTSTINISGRMFTLECFFLQVKFWFSYFHNSLEFCYLPFYKVIKNYFNKSYYFFKRLTF